MNVSLGLRDNLSSVPLDRLKIRRMLDNLIKNAVDTKLGDGTLTVDEERKDGNIVIKVSDTGVCILEENILNIFKLF